MVWKIPASTGSMPDERSSIPSNCTRFLGSGADMLGADMLGADMLGADMLCGNAAGGEPASTGRIAGAGAET